MDIRKRLQPHAHGQLQKAAAALAVREARRIEKHLALNGDRNRSVHEARKSVRWLRSFFRLSDTSLDKRLCHTDATLKSLALSLSDLRDAQVAVATLQKLAKKSTHAEAWQPMVATLAEQRNRLFDIALDRDPGFAQRRKQMRAVIATLQQMDWSRVSLDDLRDGIRRSARRVVKAKHRAHHDGTPENFHRWRRKARRLKQQLDALDSMHLLGQITEVDPFGEPATAMASLSKLTRRLGRCQDLRLLSAALDVDEVTTALPSLKKTVVREMAKGDLCVTA